MASETWSLWCAVSGGSACGVRQVRHGAPEGKYPPLTARKAHLRGRGGAATYQILSGWPSPTDSEVKRKVFWTMVRSRRGCIGHGGGYLAGVEAVGAVGGGSVHGCGGSIRNTSVGLATVCVVAEQWGVRAGWTRGAEGSYCWAQICSCRKKRAQPSQLEAQWRASARLGARPEHRLSCSPPAPPANGLHAPRRPSPPGARQKASHFSRT